MRIKIKMLDVFSITTLLINKLMLILRFDAGHQKHDREKDRWARPGDHERYRPSLVIASAEFA